MELGGDDAPSTPRIENISACLDADACLAQNWISAADVPAAASADGMWSGASPDPRRRIAAAAAHL